MKAPQSQLCDPVMLFGISCRSSIFIFYSLVVIILAVSVDIDDLASLSIFDRFRDNKTDTGSRKRSY